MYGVPGSDRNLFTLLNLIPNQWVSMGAYRNKKEQYKINDEVKAVFSHILIEWNKISDLIPFLQENKGVLVRVGRGCGGWSSAIVLYFFI
jgi:hypothetical protein